jgi:predicted GNAT superfamily acetyltransferase
MVDPPPSLEKDLTLRGRRFFLKVETSADSADYAKYDDLRQAIWGFPDDHLAGTRNMMCESFLHEGSSLFLSASTETGDLAGFAYGFVGVRDKGKAFKSLDNLWFYAQYAGVLPSWRGYGLSVALKEFQGEVVSRVLGVFEIVCTYDPLTAVNAYRNVHHFGMRVLEYRAATYGEYGGFLNRRDVPTDRFFMSWDLRPRPSRTALPSESIRGDSRPALSVETSVAVGRSGPIEVERPGRVDLDGEPAVWAVPIPSDFYLLLRETDLPDPEVRRIPLDWRMATRRVFQTLLGRGYRVFDFVSLPAPQAGKAYLLGRE